MPFIEGETLRQRLLREHQLPLGDTLTVARQVADALTFAHAHNVVHRDIKPENILLEGDQAYVADFGIARAMQVAGGDTLSSPGFAIGTPTYMSPEQAAGTPVLDGRSDLYSLACVVYEMLAGEPPHGGPTAQAILARQQTETPRSIRVLRPTLPEGVERAILTALAKPPADRFPTVSQFTTALASAAETRRTPPRPARFWPTPESRPIFVTPLLEQPPWVTSSVRTILGHSPSSSATCSRRPTVPTTIVPGPNSSTPTPA